MIVTVVRGQKVTIRFAGSNEPGDQEDGEFEIHYNTLEHPDRIVVKETAGLGGSEKGGPLEILYEEHFADYESQGTAPLPEFHLNFPNLLTEPRLPPAPRECAAHECKCTE